MYKHEYVEKVDLSAVKPIAPLTGYDVNLSREKYTVEYEKFTLTVNSGIYVKPGFADDVTSIMETIERITGLSFYPAGWENRKVQVLVKRQHNYNVESGDAEGIELLDMDTAYGEYTSNTGFSTIIHELLHCIQKRNSGQSYPGASVGWALSEGFAESFTETVEKEFGINIELGSEITLIKSYGAMYFGKPVGIDWITLDNIEQTFFIEPAHQGHETSYWIVKYIREKYDDELLKSMCVEIGKKEISSGTERERLNRETLQTIINMTGDEDFIANFYRWFKAFDMTNEVSYSHINEDTTMGVEFDNLDWGITQLFIREGYFYLAPGVTVEVDARKAVAYLQQKNIDFYGLLLSYYSGWENLECTFYDSNDKAIFVSDCQYLPSYFGIQGAVRFTIKNKSETAQFVNILIMDWERWCNEKWWFDLKK